ncbi:MAG: DNA cytosine methyltransferase [Methanobrevibacter sp.]|jgi:DNA (cytosine-5)-methyltransferase 1|nr:DNA cytosine methyltransferase [Methanobrevibacter sp.]
MKTVELFAGAGGLGLGLENAGIEHEMLVEIDKDCVATLKHNRPNWNVVHGDVQEIDFKSIKTDVVTGGFPCQAFSYAGKKLGFEDTRGTLFFEFARAVKEIEPKICLAENVEGLVRHDKGRTLKTMISVLENLGYDVQYKVLNAVNFYVPQKRKRMVLVGTRKGINFSYPQPNKKILTIKDALKNVPKSDGTGYSQKREEVLNLVPPGGCWIDLPEDIKKDFMGKSYYSGGGKRGMARRMSWNEPCLTLTTSPSQKQTERCHPEETRPFTIREYARIQTFPDDWEFMGGKSSQYKQIGNAVPVKLGEFLGKQIIKALNGDNSVDSSHQVKLSAF